MFPGEWIAWGGEQGELKSVWRFDKGASLDVSNNDTKSSLLTMESLRVLLREISHSSGSK